MAESDDPAEAAERLERALDRIAALASAIPAAASAVPAAADPPAPANGGQDAENDDETDVEVSRRLDALIGRIRAALDPQAGG